MPSEPSTTDDPQATWSAGRRFDDEYASCWAEIGQLRIHYTDWNPGAARPIVLLHGINVQGHTWDPIASVLAQHRRVICPDLRGHGRSSWAADGYRIRNFATDIVELIEQLRLRSVDIVGHSLGARVAIALTGQSPEVVTKVVLSDMGPEIARTAASHTNALAKARAERRGFRSPEEALAFYQEAHPEWQPVFHELHVRFQLRQNWAGYFVERSDPDLYWLTRAPGAWDNDFLWQCCATTSSPVLILRGKRSGYVDDGILKRMRESIHDLRDIQIDSGHYIPRERPAEFCDTVMEFLTDD